MPDKNKEAAPPEKGSFFSRMWSYIKRIGSGLADAFFGTPYRIIMTVVAVGFLVVFAIVAWELFLITMVTIVGYALIYLVYVWLAKAAMSVKKTFVKEEIRAEYVDQVKAENARLQVEIELKEKLAALTAEKLRVDRILRDAERAALIEPETKSETVEGEIVDAEWVEVKS